MHPKYKFYSQLLIVKNITCKITFIIQVMTTKMNQEEAKKLFFEGGTFIFLNVPKGTEFGIDMKIWNTDENFRGIKMIPAGIHFIHYSAVSKTGEQAPRSGFFYNFTKSELIVRRYDKQTEDICPKPVDPADVQNLKKNLVNLDTFLGPYPYEIKEKWTLLTNHITEYLVKELTSESGIIRSALTLESCNDADRPRGTQNFPSTSKIEDNTSSNRRKRRSSGKGDEEDLLPDLKPVAGTEIRFTKFPEKNYPEGSTPAEITKHSLDSTYVLNTILQRHKNVIDFLGELQFAFVCFLIGHSLEAFEHWKALVGLLCSCEEAIMKYRILYDNFVPILDTQLKEIPEEFLADIVANNNFVYLKLRNLFRVVQESNTDGRLKMKMCRFKEALSEKYFWDFSHLDDIEDDEAPVIVEM